jgi:PucR C-terminal helix-turn-helix domain
MLRGMENGAVSSVSFRDVSWITLIDYVTSHRVREAIYDRIVAELPAYRDLEPDAIISAIRTMTRPYVEALRSGRHPAVDEDLRGWEELGAGRATQGTPAEQMLHVWRILGEELWRAAQEAVSGLEHRDALLVAFYEISAEWTSLGMIASAEGHRAAEIEIRRRDEDHKAAFIRSALLGSATPTDFRSATATFGLDITRNYYVVRARPTPAHPTSEIERFLGATPGTRRRNGLVALIDGDSTGFIATLPDAPAPVSIGISPHVELVDLSKVAPLAARALDTALAFGWTGIFDLASLGLRASVVADQPVGALLSERYIAPVEKLGASGQVLLDTVDAYLTLDRKLNMTAHKLHAHVNTIRYRISRFEDITECSLRRTQTLTEVWWALQQRKLGPES